MSADARSRPTMFAGPVSAGYPTRHGRGALVALLLHAAVLAPLVVSTTRYQPQVLHPAEVEGLTFVMAPLKGAGSPAPTPPAPARREDASSQPIVETPEPVAEPPPAAAAAIPLTAPFSFAEPPPSVSSRAGSNTNGPRAEAVDEPDESSGQGVGGYADSPLAPAIGNAAEKSNWAGLVLGRLEQFRRYPPAARRDREEGVCYVKFTIDRRGHVLASALVRTSGHARLDREAITLVRRAEPLPAPPPELEGETVTLTVPVEFFLTR